jgi:flagellar basal-body rod protein FlgB
MAINFDTAFGNHFLALTLREKRAEVLAANLANADTPGYKARDMDFQSLLRGAQGSSATLATTHSSHLNAVGGSGANGRPELLYRTPAQPSLDGNSVESDAEKAFYAENALAYQTSLQFLNGKISSLLTAIRGD